MLLTFIIDERPLNKYIGNKLTVEVLTSSLLGSCIVQLGAKSLELHRRSEMTND